MREIIISTESGSDLPENLVKKYDIKVIPMHIVMDGTSYADGTISVDKIYEYHNETKKIPTTSAVNVGEYIDFFTQIRKEHPDCVIMHLAYSSLASSTYQNAEIAIREFEDIYLIDTRNVSGGCTAHLAKTYEIVQAKKDTVTDYKALADEIESWNKKVFCSGKSGLSESWWTSVQCCIPGCYTAPSETTDRDRGRTTSCLQEIPRLY